MAGEQAAGLLLAAGPELLGVAHVKTLPSQFLLLMADISLKCYFSPSSPEDAFLGLLYYLYYYYHLPFR